MPYTRSQVDEVKALLGLDPHLTASISIGPSIVIVESVAIEDGKPVIRNGQMALDVHHHEIEEAPHDGDNA
jgi:pseudouridine-5'-phosphate glycosidase